MTPQESQLLHDLLDHLTRVEGIDKDPQADALIQRAVSRQPDAAYLLVQRALLQDQALVAAKEKIADLEQRFATREPATHSFLGADNTWGNSARRDSLSAAGTPIPEQSRYPLPPQVTSPGLLGGG